MHNTLYRDTKKLNRGKNNSLSYDISGSGKLPASTIIENKNKPFNL